MNLYGIPEPLILAFLFLLGSIVGSFLDVFISRFHTGKSINGRSHCTSCGHILNWYELFPLLSYLFLRGRCRVCQASIPARLFWMEVITGLLFSLMWFLTTGWLELLFGLAFVMLTIVIVLYDIKHLVIPNVFVLVMFGLSLAHLTRYVLNSNDTLVVLPFLISGLLASSFYASLWLISKGQWIGLGDAKLALPLGFMLTTYETFSFVVLSFWVGAGISILLLLIQALFKRGQRYLRFLRVPLTMKSEVPFAPFLLIAFALVYYFHIDVLHLFAVAI